MVTKEKESLDQAAFLARASAALGSSLEYESTLQQVARIAVPYLCDACSVDVVRPDGRMERVATAHVDAERESEARARILKHPYHRDTAYGPPHVIRTGVSELHEAVSPAMIEEAVEDAELKESLIALGIRSAIIVPMQARGHTLGAISFVTDVSGRTFGQEELAVAEDLASRAALALDNARLYEEAQEAVRQRDDALRRSTTSEEQLFLLTEASNTILQSLDLESVLPAVLGLSQKLIDADAYGVWSYESETDRWRIMASRGLSEEYLRACDNLPTIVSVPDTPIVANDVLTNPTLTERRSLYLREGIRSILAVPLRMRGRYQGTITFYSRRPGRFERAEIQHATALSNIAAAAIGASELYEAELQARKESEAAESAYREAAAEAELLYRAGQLLGSTLDTNRIYSTLRELVAEIMDCDGFIISSYDSSDDLIRCAYAWVEGKEIDASTLPPVPLAPEGKGLQSHVIRTGEPMIVTDIDSFLAQSHTTYHVQPDGTYDTKPIESKPRSHAAIYAPIKLEDQVLGIIQVQSLRPGAFTGDHLRMLEALMLQVAAAGRNAFLYQQARAELAERQRTEEELARKQADIEALNERLKRAMTETHHRVKNNLQIIAAMVDMQLMEKPESVPAAQVRRLGSYVVTLSAVHDILTNQSKEDSRAQSVFARAVLAKLIPLMKQSADGRDIIWESDDLRLSAKQGTALALVINELVNNAFKHGASTATIELRSREDGLALRVTDDGPGFPPGFDPTINSNTGLELIESLSQWDLQGTTRYENNANGGACVTVEAPCIPAVDDPLTPPAIV